MTIRKLLLALILTGLVAESFLSPSPADALHKTALRDEVGSEYHLLEIGAPPKVASRAKPSSEFKIVSYNIRWRSGENLSKLAQLLKDDAEIGGASVLGLQEVDRNKKRSGNKNTAAILAEQLGMHYAWAAPPVAKTGNEEETGVAILSVFPLHDVRRLVLPHKGPGGRRRAAIGATIKTGRMDLRVYSVHSETRLAVSRKLEQSKAVIDDLAGFDKGMPAVVLGDLNTWEPAAISKTSKLFAAENFHTPFDNDSTFFRRVLFVPIKLKLDWIWLRNLEATKNGIDQSIKLSDHWPLWIVVKTPPAN